MTVISNFVVELFDFRTMEKWCKKKKKWPSRVPRNLIWFLWVDQTQWYKSVEPPVSHNCNRRCLRRILTIALWIWEIPEGRNLSRTVSVCQQLKHRHMPNIPPRRLDVGVCDSWTVSVVQLCSPFRSRSLHLKRYYSTPAKRRKDGWMNGRVNRWNPRKTSL